MEKEKFLSILREMRIVCNEVNEETKKLEPENKVRYEVLQFSDLARKWDSVYNIADFYNHNWLGNVDFMHIPDFSQTLENCKNYPIIIAREEGKDEILGISTIKYDENNKSNIDPYFPEEDAKYFSVTGILTKRNNVHRGIGKKIYEIAIRGAHNYEKYYPGTRIMCVIDCRNRQSLRALSSAVENINSKGYVGEGKELPAHILGYYELRDKEKNKLLEAPTLVMEVGLDEQEKEENQNNETIDYVHREGEELFDSLLSTLKTKFGKYGINSPIIQEDTECGMVYFYSLEDRENCRLQGIKINSNGTEKGNDRVPRDDNDVRTFIGPIPSISIEEER